MRHAAWYVHGLACWLRPVPDAPLMPRGTAGGAAARAEPKSRPSSGSWCSSMQRRRGSGRQLRRSAYASGSSGNLHSTRNRQPQGRRRRRPLRAATTATVGTALAAAAAVALSAGSCCPNSSSVALAPANALRRWRHPAAAPPLERCIWSAQHRYRHVIRRQSPSAAAAAAFLAAAMGLLICRLAGNGSSRQQQRLRRQGWPPTAAHKACKPPRSRLRG
jgi:hypothetical protein